MHETLLIFNSCKIKFQKINRGTITTNICAYYFNPWDTLTLNVTPHSSSTTLIMQMWSNKEHVRILGIFDTLPKFTIHEIFYNIKNIDLFAKVWLQFSLFDIYNEFVAFCSQLFITFVFVSVGILVHLAACSFLALSFLTFVTLFMISFTFCKG